MLRAHLGGAGPVATSLDRSTTRSRPLGERLEHVVPLSPLRCFLCTACRLTSSASPISCQDQPAPARADLQALQLLEQPPQRPYGTQADPGSGALAAVARSDSVVMVSI